MLDHDLVDELVVATDSSRIAEAVKPTGVRVVLTRDSHPTGTDRVAEVAAQPFAAEYSVIVNIQGDEPFIQPEQINKVLACFSLEEAQIATLIKPFSSAEIKYFQVPHREEAMAWVSR